MALIPLLILATINSVQCQYYQIGIGIADMTGPPVEVPFMGYANLEQKGQGIHLRQFARTFILNDGQDRLVFVSADCGMMGSFVRKEVLEKLRGLFGNVYTARNVMLSGSHTHSTPGGFLQYTLFDMTTYGFVGQSFTAYVNGIVRSISRAHDKMIKGKMFMTKGKILNASVNRSPTSYLLNPPEERARYESNVDRIFTQLKFIRDDGEPLGAFTWFAVHPTSMNNTNKLVSSDNVGYASILFEKMMNDRFTPLIGKGPFVAAFSSSNLGDVSPNIRPPKCHKSGVPCDAATSSCPTNDDKCVASGPGNDMFESTSIIAHRIFENAWNAWNSPGEEITGKIRVVFQNVHMPSQNLTIRDSDTGETFNAKGCLPAMGYSFAAGTVDGPGHFDFRQGTKTPNPMWNAITRFIVGPSREQMACQAPKPVLLSTGEIKYPHAWQPSIVTTQLTRIGSIVIACVPGEFTTMSGRRLRDKLSHQFNLPTRRIIIAGLCNTYSDYITTFEEYAGQRYEAASTIYGPHTLTIYLEQYAKLARYITKGLDPEPGPDIEDLPHKISLLPGVIFDNAGFRRDFGQVLTQPKGVYRTGEIVFVSFIAGNPRNGINQENTYLTVERLSDDDQWVVVATDANWETKFIWRRDSTIKGTSHSEVFWTIPRHTKPGIYRIRHFGHYKYVYGRIESYSGASNTFKVIPS